MSFLDQLNVSIDDDRARAAAEYPQILRRSKSPNPGDVERLRQIMAVLGYNEKAVESDLRAVQTEADMNVQIARCSATEDAAKQNQRMAELVKQIDEASKTLFRLEQEKNTLSGSEFARQRMLTTAYGELRLIRSTNPRLYPPKQ